MSSAFYPTGLTFTDIGALGQGSLPIISDPALPVELTTFSVEFRDGVAELSWKTHTEVNNYGFNVERKSSTEKWEEIGFVQGHGNSNSIKNYKFEDHSIWGNCKYFYRLKQIDVDGKYEYSDVIEVSSTSTIQYLLRQNYPNPFNPTTSISYSIPIEGEVTLSIYDLLGSEIITLINKEQTQGNYEVEFDGSDLSSGIYFYKLQVGKFVEIKKMNLLK